MRFREFFKLSKTPPKLLVFLSVVFILLSLEPFFSGELKDFGIFETVFLLILYFSTWMLIRGVKWARWMMFSIMGFLLVSSSNFDDTSSAEAFLRQFEFIFFFVFIIYLNLKEARSYFGEEIKEGAVLRFADFFKNCPSCSSKLGSSDVLNVLRMKEIKCKKCGSFLRQDFEQNAGWMFLLKIELIVVPAILLFVFLLELNYVAIGITLLFMLAGLLFTLLTLKLVRFSIPNEKYLNQWVRGGEPGKSLTEHGQEVILPITYVQTYQRCKDALIKIGSTIDFESLEDGIVRSSILLIGNRSLPHLILLNFEKSEQGTRVKVFARSNRLWAQDDFGVSGHITNQVIRVLNGENVSEIRNRFVLKDLLVAIPFILGLSMLALFFDLKLNSIPIVDWTFSGIEFFLVTSLVYFLIYQVFKTSLFRFIENLYYSSSSSINPHSIVMKIYTHMTLLPIFALIITGLFWGNAYFDNTPQKTMYARVDGLEKVGDDRHRDYCFHIFSNGSSGEQITSQRYCLKDGYTGLRRGDKVKITYKEGLFKIPWAQKISIAKYESIDSFLLESKSLSFPNFSGHF